MDQRIVGRIDYRGLVLQGVEHDAETPIGAEAHRAEALFQLDHSPHRLARRVDHRHGAVLAIGHIRGPGQRRIHHRQWVRTGLELFEQGQAGDIDDAHRAVVAVGDEGKAAVLAEGDLVVTAAGGQVLEGFQAAGVNDGDPGLLRCLGVVAHPQQALVRLQGHAHRVAAGRDRIEQLELFSVDHCDFASGRHRHEHAFVIAWGDPVHRRLLDVDPRHGAGDAAHRHRRVHHRNAGIAVHHQYEIAVEIEQWPRADA
ncbi:hypothetical protein D3C87_1329120 [compost metagenome]